MSRIKLILILGIIFGMGWIVYFPGRRMARDHVNNKTAVTDHPLLCTSCHVYTSKNKFISKIINADYYSPFNIAVSKNGNRLYVVAQDSDELMVVDPEKNKVVDKIAVGEHPHSVILDKNEKFAYVSNEWSDNVSVIDVATSIVIDTLYTGNGPAGLALSSNEKYLYVVNAFGSDLSVIDLSTKEERKRLITGNNPTGTSLSPDGKFLYVTSRRANIAPYGEPLISELTIINDSTQRSMKKNIESAYLMENVTFAPDGDLALMTLIRPKNNIPSIQVEQGWMMTHGIGIVEHGKGGRVVQLLLDEPNAYYPDPFDIVITPDGKKAFVSNSGVDCISVIAMDSIRSILAESSPEMLKRFSNDLGVSHRFVIKRIPTGANPKGLALSSDGKRLYVAEQLEDKIGVINTESLETMRSIDLGGPGRITVARHGRRLFNNAGHTFQNQFSCYTCHPDTHEDGLVYNMAAKNMGRNLANTLSLREIGDTAPFKWNGKNQTVYKQDGIRFSTVLTRTEQFSYKDLDAIVAYIKRGIKQPPNLMYNPNGELTASQLQGKLLFERNEDNSGNVIPEKNRCITCHPPPLFTNLKMAHVSTLAETDDPTRFDTPQLINIHASAPYLHDGRAATLEEIWTIYGTDDKHGYVNDMTKMQLNDMVDYLKSLRGPGYEHGVQIVNTSHIKN
ncbi:MAG: beta-propeller fold lactonase family protein [Bacteroidetes bacterium]|nr:beta-propeller fold lactonase family protein [Bacteroidota bacterium]